MLYFFLQILADDQRQTTFFLFLDILENTRQAYLANEYRKGRHILTTSTSKRDQNF